MGPFAQLIADAKAFAAAVKSKDWVTVFRFVVKYGEVVIDMASVKTTAGPDGAALLAGCPSADDLDECCNELDACRSALFSTKATADDATTAAVPLPVIIGGIDLFIELVKTIRDRRRQKQG